MSISSIQLDKINKINRNLQWFHRVALLPLNPIGIYQLDFCGGRKIGEHGEKPSKQGRESTTNSTNI
jgi:hypothetical protein